MSKSISSNQLAWCALLMILVLTGIIRYGLLNVSLQRDEGEYAYAAQLIMQGIPPYQGIYNMKLPGTYGAYALLLGLFGQTHQGIHMGLLVINAVTILLVFQLAKHFINPFGALAAAATFAVLSMGQWVHGIFANAEHFVLPFSIGGLLLALRALRKKSYWMFFISGFVLGIGVLMKQHGIFFVGFGLIYIVVSSFYQHPVKWQVLVLQTLFFILGTVAVYTMLCLTLAVNGVFSSFWFWTFDYALRYSAQIPLQIAWRKFTETAMPILQSAPLLWGLAGLGVIALAVKKGRHEKRIFLALYALFSLIAICPGFYFRPHYYLLLLPAAALLAGISIETLQDVLGRLHSRIARNAILILVISFCLGLSLYQQRDFFFHMTPLQISRSTYGSNPFHESLEVAKFIQEHTRPNDRIAILGSEPQIYFYSQRHSASSYIYMYPLMEEHEFAIEMQKEMIKQIEASRPTVIVFVNISSSWSSRPTSHKKVFDWFNKYTSNDYKLAGVVELFEEETLYHWRPHLKWPADSPYWILLFERIL